MTTAAAIWMTAAIGMTVGVGLPAAGLGLTLLGRGVLAGVHRWEVRHLGGLKSVVIEIVFDPDHGKTVVKLARVREGFHVGGQFSLQPVSNEGTVRGELAVELPRRHLHEFLDELASLPAVREIRELPAENH